MELQDIQRIAVSVHQIRQQWPVESLKTFIRNRADRMTALDLHLQLIYVAHDPATTTPARIDQHGPWKYLLTGPREQTVTYREASPRDCGVCNKPESECLKDGHDYTPAFVRHDDRAAPDLIARVRQAAIDNHQPLKRLDEEPTTTEES